MSATSKIALGVASGYLLGRTKKLKLAVTVGSMLAGQRIATDRAGLLTQGAQLVDKNPELAKIRDQITGALLQSAKTAALAHGHLAPADLHQPAGGWSLLARDARTRTRTSTRTSPRTRPRPRTRTEDEDRGRGEDERARGRGATRRGARGRGRGARGGARSPKRNPSRRGAGAAAAKAAQKSPPPARPTRNGRPRRRRRQPRPRRSGPRPRRPAKKASSTAPRRRRRRPRRPRRRPRGEEGAGEEGLIDGLRGEEGAGEEGLIDARGDEGPGQEGTRQEDPAKKSASRSRQHLEEPLTMSKHRHQDTGPAY